MSLRLILSIGTMTGGLIFGIGGIYLLATQKFVKDESNETEIEIPFFGRIKTNYPSVIAVFIGAVLLCYPLLKLPSEIPDKITIKGRVTQGGQAPKKEIFVVFAPAKYKNFTSSDGTVSIEVDDVPGQGHYTGIAYFTDGSCTDVKFDDVKTPSAGKGEFNVDIGGIGCQH